MVSILQKLLPRWIFQRLIGNWNHAGYKKYFANTGWMFLARIATFATSFFTMAIVARYLGPENLGKLDYALSLVTIFSVFATLGIDQIVYRNLVTRPEEHAKILGTAICTKLAFGFVAILAVITTSLVIDADPVLTVLVGIIALTFIFSPFGTVNHFFQAQVQAKYSSQATIFLSILLPILKLLIVYFDKGIIYFASVFAV
jgi:O-antigen/teichoic acid export membrane protein